MSRGCPTISSNAGALPDLVRNNFVHNVGDALELSNLIKKIYNDKNLMTELVKYSFDKASEYTLEILNDKIEEFFNIIINEINERVEKI